MTEEINRPSTSDSKAETYDPVFFSQLDEAEARHFWFRVRNTIIVQAFKQITAQLPEGFKFIEIGCGTGNVLKAIESSRPKGSIAGMDLFPCALDFARRRTSCLLIEGNIMAPPFEAESFDVLGIFDVLEHLPGDTNALLALHNLLRSDGHILITVPAHPCLWSYFDEVACHQRRYTPKDLESKLKQCGFSVEYLTYFMSAIFPIVWLRRKLAGSRAGGEGELDTKSQQKMALRELETLPVINQLLTAVLRLEAPIVRRRYHLPVGTSLLAIARKESQ